MAKAAQALFQLSNASGTIDVSNGLIKARFGSKERLWKDAVDHGMQLLENQLEEAHRRLPHTASYEERLKNIYVTFLLGLNNTPAILRLMNREGQRESDRLAYIYERYSMLSTFQGSQVYAEGVQAGVFREVSSVIMFFLVAHGGASMFALGALAARLNGPENHDALEPRASAEAIADVLINGILATSAHNPKPST